MRGELSLITIYSELDRITPAYAGRTHMAPKAVTTRRDHPRVCGENGIISAFNKLANGSPPRMRGEHN